MTRFATVLRTAGAVPLMLLLAWLVCGCNDTGPPRRTILIVLDAARPDRFGCYGYPKPTTPNVDALAAGGVVFRNHFSQGTDTRTALPPLLYSRYYVRPVFPNSDRVPYSAPEDLFRTLDRGSISLPRVLAANGIRTVMISAHTWLKDSTAFASEFDEAYDLSSIRSVDPRYGYPRAEEVIDFTLRWLGQNGRDEYFIYLHLMDAHFPHYLEEDASALLDEEVRRSPPVGAFTEAGSPARLDAALSGPERLYMDALYDGGLRYADHHIGRLLDHLGPAIENTLLVVTSDHGEYLLERPRRLGHGYPWYDAMGRVPLIISYPGVLAPADTDMLTESVDVAPTVLGLLKIPVPPGRTFDGVDLDAVSRGEIPPKDLVCMPRAARTKRYKVLFQSEEALLLGESRPDPAGVAGRLYDLEKDPDEIVDLWADMPDLIGGLLDRYRSRMIGPYRRYMEARTDRQPASAFAISAKYLRTLEAIPVANTLEELEARMSGKEGWIRLNDAQGQFLVADGGAGPITIQIPVPNGPYLLSAAIRGTCSVRMESPGSRRFLRARRFDGSEYFPWEADQVEYGRIEVEGGVLRATVEPERDGSPLLIGFLGFRPLGQGEEADPEREKERLDRLRALGYVR